MSDSFSKAINRLNQTKGILSPVNSTQSIPWDPHATSFPLRKSLPKINGAPNEAAWVWGEDDNLGRLNLLTPDRVRDAAKHIKTGEMARVDLPMHIPKVPAFGRKAFKHLVKEVVPGRAFDDEYSLNTQSGTQWDGFRHVGIPRSNIYYNNAKPEDYLGAKANLRNSIHYWSQSGFSGRALLLDFKEYATQNDSQYNSADGYRISYDDLVACGKFQGIDIRPMSEGGDVWIGDILLMRTGWVSDYYKNDDEENARLARRRGSEDRWAGLEANESTLTWLHDCYFAAVGGDAPAFEAMPLSKEYSLHEYLLPRWGIPIGEMLDLEKVSQLAKKNKTYFFFFTSGPANVEGGVASHVNGTAIF